MPAEDPQKAPARESRLATLGIEIELGSAPIRGVCWNGDRARARPFCGWLELAERIEDARLSEGRGEAIS